jgi:2-polyprenyl-3-methyl-5-hydroxy-6-metoxy-1,4-benzoquinol methylase
MNTTKLKELYHKTSKHSNYQILPEAINKYLSSEELNVNSRYEQERFNFLKTHIDFSGKTIVDIGGNTGFFSFQCIEEGASEVLYIEGNKEHAEFVKYAATELDYNIKVENAYFSFDSSTELNDNIDVVLLFNVLHHLGDDFGDKNISIDEAKKKMADSVNFFHDKTQILVLQLGYCWKGDRNHLLFENGSKNEMIDFVQEMCDNKWRIAAVGVPHVENGITCYEPINEFNLERKDEIGEFRNRPIFVLEKLEIFDDIKELDFLNKLVKDYKDTAPYSKIKKEIILDLISNSLSKYPKRTKALQLGCSNGEETAALSKIFPQLTVVDGSSVFIDRVRNQNKNGSTQYIHALFEDLDTKLNQKYDVVFCNYILEHVFDPNRILNSIANLLNPDGLLFAVVPNANALSRRLAKEMGLVKNLYDLTQNDLDHGHRRVYTKDRFKDELLHANFEIIEVKGVVFKILADFQLNELLKTDFLNKNHIRAMQELAAKEENIQYSDSIYIVAKRALNE